MAVFLTVLKVLGIVVLVLLALLLILMLLVLFVPFRYQFSGGINDPEGDTRAFHLDPKKDISAEGNVRWLLGALNVTGAVGGQEEGSGAARVELRIFGRKYPIEKLLGKKEELREEEKEEKPKEPEEKKTLEEKIEAALQRVERLSRRIDDALRALQTEYGVRAKEVIIMRILHMIEQCMPTQWGLTGVLGLGDPARSAKVFAVQGYLYPLTAGHVAIGTDYELYRYDLQGAARGKIRIITFVYGGIRLLLSRDVRRLLRRLRRGSAPGHRYTNGNNKQAIAAGNVQERIK
jgi:hypothetical protein